MDFSSLNVDVLLHLMKFLKPDDRFNLVLSGILKGFENANEGIDLRQRYSSNILRAMSVVIKLLHFQNRRFWY
jgi:hypothetical protein